MSITLSDEQLYKQLTGEDHPGTQTPPPAEPPAAEPPAAEPPAQEPPAPAAPPPAPSVDDLDDAALEALLKKRGINKSLSELTQAPPPAAAPPEDEAEKKRKREAEKLKFAIDKNLVTVDQYDAFQQARARSARELVWEQFREQHADKGLSDEELELRFSRLYFEDVDEEFTPLRELRQADLDREAARILRKRFPELHRLDQTYEQWEQEQLQQAERARTEAAQRTRYQQDIDRVFSSIQKKEFRIKDDEGEEAVDFSFPPDQINAVKQEFLSDARFARLADASAEELQSVAETALLQLNLGNAVAHTAKVYAAKKVAAAKIGRKNMSPDDVGGGVEAPERDEQLYSMLRDFVPQQPK